jgi:AAA domain
MGKVESNGLRLIFIYGLPGTGKLTVARELAALTGFKLFHNHLAVDLLLSVFEFGTAPFVELREQIWLSVFEQAGGAQLPGLIFTFAPEKTVRPAFIGEARQVVESAGGTVDFVELICPLAELKRRIKSPPRQECGKITSVTLFERLHAEGAFDSPAMPKPTVTIDTSAHSPAQAAAQIQQALGLSGIPEG